LNKAPSPAGNDLLFDEKLVEQGRNFSNKIWNAFRLVKGWELADLTQPEENKLAAQWFKARLNESMTELEDHFSKFRMSDALMTVYKLVWNDFCSWYLEWIKPEYQKPIDAATLDETINIFEQLMKLLHPFMPFITEELWHGLKNRSDELIINAAWPQPEPFDSKVLQSGELLFELTSNIRNLRSSKGLSPKESLDLIIKTTNQEDFTSIYSSVQKLGNVKDITFSNQKPENASSFVLGANEFFVPLNLEIDTQAERQKLEEELRYAQGFLKSVEKKLSNEKFVNGAPAQVVENEKKKKADAEAKIKAIEASLEAL
jgi:valyl-tRNA synthetase